MKREKIENVLMDMGVPAGINGFVFIADAVEYIDKHEERISATKELYPEIAKNRGVTPSKVERAIRHAFEVARGERGDYEMAEKYIGFMDCSNFNSLMRLHKKIKQECDEIEIEHHNEEEVSEPIGTTITALEIREIFRQELRMVLNELKGAMI